MNGKNAKAARKAAVKASDAILSTYFVSLIKARFPVRVRTAMQILDGTHSGVTRWVLCAVLVLVVVLAIL